MELSDTEQKSGQGETIWLQYMEPLRLPLTTHTQKPAEILASKKGLIMKNNYMHACVHIYVYTQSVCKFVCMYVYAFQRDFILEVKTSI